MACIKDVFVDLYLFIKMFILSTKYMILEACSSIRPLEGKNTSCEITLLLAHLTFSCHVDPVDRKGEYAVITGGNRGIGWYTVKGLVENGMKVIVGKIFL